MSAYDSSRIQADYDGLAIRSGSLSQSGSSRLLTSPRSRVLKLSSVLENLFVILLLLSSMNVLTALTPSSKAQTEVRAFSANVDTTSVAIEAGIYLYGAVFVLMRWRRVLNAARTVWPLLCLPGLALLSTAWSVQPTVTLRRSVPLLAATMIAIYIGERYSIKEFAHLLTRVLCLMIALVVLFYLVAPNYVVEYSAYNGAWKGLSTYKNTFGEYMAIAVLLLALVRFHRFFWLRYLFLVIAAGLLLLSRSATALACGFVALSAIPLWRLTRGKHRLLICALMALIFLVGIYWILAFPETIFQVLGRDATLTGRTKLWATLLPVIANRPILGYGYGAFWTGSNADVLGVWVRAGRLVPIADNGYIDLCLGLGAFGVLLYLYVFVGAFQRAMQYVRSEPGFIGLWPVSYLFIFAADNVCEGALLTRGTFPFLVFAILTTSLWIHHRNALTHPRRAGYPRVMSELNSPAI